jgi:hypothetical protein
MPRDKKRKYEKIDDAEIELVVQCADSHEFYERYRQEFPTRKKGIDSISKIWKRRGEFLKKLQPTTTSIESSDGSFPELGILIAAQNKILADLSGVMKDHLLISKEILARLPKNMHHPEDTVPQNAKEVRHEQKESSKKPIIEKPSDIMIGS